MHYVKIDGQFVRGLDKDPVSRIIVSSLNEIAGVRGIRCIAEWVESQAVLGELRSMGVHYAQGFHIHEPDWLAPLVGLAGDGEAVRGRVPNRPEAG